MTRTMAPLTVVRSSSVSMSAIVRVNNDLLLFVPNKQGQKARKGKEDDVHDAKRPARLEHTTGLIDADMDAMTIEANTTQIATNGPAGIGLGDGGAVGVADEAQLVDTRDERADNADVDEGDEEGV